MSTRVIAILVDALRYDWVNERDTPFIHSLTKHGLKLPLKPILGYSDAIRATIFTGTYPDRHGYWMSVCYSPETSPFKKLTRLSMMDYIPSDFIRRGIKFLLSSTIIKVLARPLGYRSLRIYNIPFRVLPRFDMTMRKRMTDPGAFASCQTLFDTLRSHGMKFAYLDSSRLKRKLLREIANLDPDTKMVFVYLHYVDEASHWFGLKSSQLRKSLKLVDGIVRRIACGSSGTLPESTALIVFSDHGMVEERSRVSLDWLLRRRDFGKDFVACLDATMIRVWYERSSAKAGLRRIISEATGFALLSKARKKALGIDFNDRRYGDDIFLAEEGQIVFPNFFSYVRPRAMHAYDPELPSQQGVLVLYGPRNATMSGKECAQLVDIAPTVLELLDIPDTSGPGRSLCSKK